MRYLALVSLIWAFSFGLIGSTLKGVDPYFVASVRLAVALLIFLPFLRIKNLERSDFWRLPLIGAIQFGVMYVTYIQAFRYLPSHLVALFSILTPVYVVLINDIRQRTFHRRYLLVALLSIGGAGIIRFQAELGESIWAGFALMQIAGIAFAFGQVVYRDWKIAHPKVADRNGFALLYAGGLLFALTGSGIGTDWSTLEVNREKWQALLYLGAIASGGGFFLWNVGASKTNPGTLAAFNNAVVPLGVFCSLFIFGEWQEVATDDAMRLGIGAFVIFLAVWLNRRSKDNPDGMKVKGTTSETHLVDEKEC